MKKIKWLTIIICIYAIVITVMYHYEAIDMIGEPIRPIGSEQIYPTIMVNDTTYFWDYYCNELPEDCVFYGEINHTLEKVPEENCELVCVFCAEGEVYTRAYDEKVYLVMDTYWMEDAIVAFSMYKEAVG